MKTYTPAPLDTRDIELPKELDGLIEEMARNVHEVWAQGRIAEGWTGASSAMTNSRHILAWCPMRRCLMPNAEYDRQTAVQTLKLILKLGFKIHK